MKMYTKTCIKYSFVTLSLITLVLLVCISVKLQTWEGRCIYSITGLFQTNTMLSQALSGPDEEVFQWKGFWKSPWNFSMQDANTTEYLPVYPEQGTGTTVDISKQFNFSIFNTFCTSVGHLKAVLPIYSSADRFKTRNILRETLGKCALSLKSKIFFIVGISPDENVNNEVKKEYESKKDMLMVGKIDTYRDLNNKAMAMLKWISHHCVDVSYVIHLIDDAFINLPYILKRIDAIRDDTFALGIPIQSKAVKDNTMKTFVTDKEYPYDDFPLYLYGFAYVFPRNVTERLLSVVNKATYCWIEDVWLMGHVRIEAGVKTIGHVGANIRHPVQPGVFKRLYSRTCLSRPLNE